MVLKWIFLYCHFIVVPLFGSQQCCQLYKKVDYPKLRFQCLKKTLLTNLPHQNKSVQLNCVHPAINVSTFTARKKKTFLRERLCSSYTPSVFTTKYKNPPTSLDQTSWGCRNKVTDWWSRGDLVGTEQCREISCLYQPRGCWWSHMS